MWNGSHNLQHLIEKQEQVDQQQQAQFDAVSALASLQQPAAGRFAATRVDPFTEAYHLVAQAQQQQVQPMARQFSDGSDPYGRTANGAAAAGFPAVDANALLTAQATYGLTAAAAASYPDLAAASTGSGVSSYPSIAAAAATAYSPESPSFEQQPRASSPPAVYAEGNGGTTANGFAYEQSYEHQPTPAPRGKPEAMARALAASQLEADAAAAAAAASEEDEEPPLPPPRKTPKKKASTPKKKKRSSASSTAVSSSLIPARRSEYVMGEAAPPITEDQYANLDELLTEFCRVPLLAEFSRPVSLLHPDLAKSYSGIVSLPVDLGHVCRGIRRREYKTCRDVRLDMWLVFSNCVKYNSHPGNKDAIPSFVSIAQHLREYFNQLWQECMIPSELPEDATELLRVAFEDRAKDRQNRLDSTGVLVLHNTFLVQLSARLTQFLDRGGCADLLDANPIFHENGGETEVDLVVQRLREFQRQLYQHAQDAAVEYQLVQLHGDLERCYTEDVLQDDPGMRSLFQQRIERFLWRQCTSLHEANSRGVTQSSIWGNIAACIWARESSKKAYWPAICLGILPPPEQGEGWHHAVTERNENRLPHNLRGPLAQAKKQCEKNQKRAKHSYFLVEFLGTHEFTWVRETDIVENFDADPANDPNKKPAAKKGRASRSGANALGSKLYQRAIEECVFANNEYESVLNDAMSTPNNSANGEDDDDDEMNYSYLVLAQSDDEADMTESHGYDFSEDAMSNEEVEEVNYLLAHNGFLDISAVAKKTLKKKSPAPKKDGPKKKASIKDEVSATKKSKPDATLKPTKAQKTEQKELERRRKKRTRDREKALRLMARKKRRWSSNATSDGGTADCDDGYDLGFDKKNRATAIVKAYLHRLSKKEKSLALSGVLTMPAAMVDSTGVLGSTIAFRAAAGLLRMPDDGKEAEEKRKPWLAIDPSCPKASQDRLQLLQKKLGVMQQAMQVVRNDARKRRELAASFTTKQVHVEERVLQDDVLARQNTFKKKAASKKAAAATTVASTKPTPIKCPKKVIATAQPDTDEPMAVVQLDEQPSAMEVDAIEVVVEVEEVVGDEEEEEDGASSSRIAPSGDDESGVDSHAHQDSPSESGGAVE